MHSYRRALAGLGLLLLAVAAWVWVSSAPTLINPRLQIEGPGPLLGRFDCPRLLVRGEVGTIQLDPLNTVGLQIQVGQSFDDLHLRPDLVAAAHAARSEPGLVHLPVSPELLLGAQASALTSTVVVVRVVIPLVGYQPGMLTSQRAGDCAIFLTDNLLGLTGRQFLLLNNLLAGFNLLLGLGLCLNGVLPQIRGQRRWPAFIDHTVLVLLFFLALVALAVFYPYLTSLTEAAWRLGWLFHLAVTALSLAVLILGLRRLRPSR